MLINPNKDKFPVGTILNSFTLPNDSWKVADGSLINKSDYQEFSSKNLSIYPNGHNLWITEAFSGTGSTSNLCKAIAYNGTTFVVVCGINTNEYFTSTDGENWTSRTFPITANWKDISWGETAGVFVAITSANNFYYSSDGTSWTASTPPNTRTWVKIEWNGTYFCVVTDSTYCVTSSNGINWSEYTLPTGTTNSLIIHKNYFYIIKSTFLIYKSSNGQSWTQLTTPPLDVFGNIYISSNDNIIIAIGDSGRYCISYDDGDSWDSGYIVNSLYSYSYWSVIYPNFDGSGIRYKGGYFWIMDDYNYHSIIFSSDGFSWTRLLISIQNNSFNPIDVEYDGSNFVIIGFYSTYRSFIKSNINYDPDVYVKLPNIRYLPYHINGAYPIIKVK